MALTIYDISKKAGVSTATVSRVLNGSDKVKADTRQKILDIMKEYDYAPSAFARGMGLHSLKTIGILCADSSDLFLAKAVYYLEQELQKNGYESLLCCTGYNLDIRKNYVNLILSKKIDALILVGSNFIGSTKKENQYIKDASAQLPVMVLNAAYEHPNVYSTLCDDAGAMEEAANALLSFGIRDILYLYNSESYSGKRKLEGFCSAMEKAGVADYKKLIRFYQGETCEAGEIAYFIGQVADSGLSFHGLLASDDILAVGGVKYAQRKGLTVPRDLAVIGYNNSILTGCCTPELTSVDNCLKAQTHQLIHTLLGVLSGEEMPRKTVFSGTLVPRGSTPS